MAHELEAWGDARAWDGTVSIQQPLIEPLYGGKTPIELLALLLGEESGRGYDLVRRTLKSKFAGAGDFEAAWKTALHDGVVKSSGWEAKSPAITVADWSKPLADLNGRWTPADTKSFEISFAQDHKVYDGRYVNNAWLQELPDPITKLTWDNAALISVADANRLGVRRDDRIEIALGSAKLSIPVCVVPGHAPGSITLPLGYGRAAAGKVAEGSGFDVNVLRSKSAFYYASGASIRVAGGSYALATTQDHHAMDTSVGNKETQRRVPELAREASVYDYDRDHKFAAKKGHQLPLVQMFGDYDHVFKQTHRWAMAIDLSKCTGCSACVVACQAENNIPVVGKHEVQLGREMHWMRIDRYFISGKDDPDHSQVIYQPVACQHCENAPCEQVCPVAATVHDEQGLNVMVYNRCIGTRYCSNNCPYKVRRFNWFYNHHGPRHPRSRQGGKTVFQTFDIKNTPNMLAETDLTDIEKMAFNPEVTVRSRGVMEKCTFCVQRIAHAKVLARNEQVSPRHGVAGSGEIPDQTVRPACQDVCPAEAIEFGDLNVKGSRVSQWHDHERSYVMLEEINVRPRNKYLAKLRNPLHDEGGAGGAHGAEHA
jgi:molybdopterin-containing oxidoreductase family iron-sulfur binding subunit